MSQHTLMQRLEIESLQLKAVGDKSSSISAKLFDLAIVAMNEKDEQLTAIDEAAKHLAKKVVAFNQRNQMYICYCCRELSTFEHDIEHTETCPVNVVMRVKK
jgi:hypothetical protein